MKVLVTGGTGYIGSHTVVELLNKGYEVIIADNLCNSHIKMLDHIKTITGKDPIFYQVDVTDKEKTKEIFKAHQIEGIIHFAGLKAVGESVVKPLTYYKNNVLSTIVLAELAVEFNVSKLIFSSSATVYGDNKVPFVETMTLLPTTNPYGETKAMSERILMDAAKAHSGLSVTLLRYFNPIGAHESGLIGELPQGVPNNLMPYITQTAKGIREKLFVFGDDYDTIDGTGVRDYIHVIDLAKGHVKALENTKKAINIYNLGTGKGTSVLQLIQAFEKENQMKIPYEVVERRAGDIATSYANAQKAKEELNWEATKTINDMVKDSWKFEKNIK